MNDGTNGGKKQTREVINTGTLTSGPVVGVNICCDDGKEKRPRFGAEFLHQGGRTFWRTEGVDMIYSTVRTGCHVPVVTSSTEWRMMRSGWIGIPRDYHIDVSEMNGKGKIERKLTWTKWRHPRATRLMRVCKDIRPS